jgi:uncharacterized protein
MIGPMQPFGGSEQGQPRPLSPCTQVCMLDEQGFCIGCRRTAAEIGRWTTMSPAEQWRLIAELRTRVISR